MRLWTIQPPEVLRIIETTGRFSCDASKSMATSDYPTFKNAYNWLSDQMKYNHRVEAPDYGYKGITYPVWAWYKREWENKKPDLRHSGFAPRGTILYCIELEIEPERVLLSDFDAWHFVLSNTFLDGSKGEIEWEAAHKWFNGLNEELREEIKLYSWEFIFDITPFENNWRTNGKYIQATFWEIKRSDIIKVQQFKAR